MYFDTCSHYVSLAGLELSMSAMLASNWKITSTGNKDTHHSNHLCILLIKFAF